MGKDVRSKTDTVRFFPIFLAASLSAVIDSTQVFIDEAVVGNLFDDVAFGSINLLEPYLLLETIFSYLVCVGGPAMIIRARGANKPEEMRRIFNHCITCDLIIGLTFFTVLSLFQEPLVRLVAQDSAAYTYALKLIYWDRYSFLVIALYDFLFTYSVYLGGALIGSVSMLTKMGVNTVLSVVLGKSMGIAGVTCATFIANSMGLIILLAFVIYRHKGIGYRPYLNITYLKTLTLLSLPEASLFAAVFILESGANALALRAYSVQGVAVIAIVINLFEFAVYVSEGISEYETAAINQALGEGNRDKIISSMKTTFRAVFVEGVIFSLLFLFAAPLLVDLFDIDDPETVKNAASAIRIFAIAPVFLIIIRITAIFNQYTRRIGKAILIWICCVGLLPLVFVFLLSGISVVAMSIGFVIGPAAAVALLWLIPGRRKAGDVRLKRMTVIFDDEQ